jgi:hypothetical protein
MSIKDKKRDDNIANLSSSGRCIIELFCDKCKGEAKIDAGGEYEGAEAAYEDGWRNPIGHNTYCPKCAEKHKIK